MKTQELIIKGMTCHHCVMSVKQELSKLEGLDVLDVQIGKAQVQYEEGNVKWEDLNRAINEAGYELAMQ